MRTNYQTKFSSTTTFLDMVLNLAVAFAFLFVFAFIFVRPPTPQAITNVSIKAEFVITLSWPDGALDDVDLWVQLPNGDKVMYLRKDLGTVVLDRDDLGGGGSDIPGDCDTRPCDDSEWIKINREIATIRSIQPGRYVIAVHVFSEHDVTHRFHTLSPLPYKAHVEAIKLNPTATIVATADPLLVGLDDRITVFAFTVGDQGQVVSVEYNPPDQVIDLIKKDNPETGGFP